MRGIVIGLPLSLLLWAGVIKGGIGFWRFVMKNESHDLIWMFTTCLLSAALIIVLLNERGEQIGAWLSSATRWMR